jgi:hypothetical protein
MNFVTLPPQASQKQLAAACFSMILVLVAYIYTHKKKTIRTNVPLGQVKNLVESEHFRNSPRKSSEIVNGQLKVIRILNTATVKEVSAKLGIELHPTRFKPNIVLEDMKPWEEFQLAGSTIEIGDCCINVLEKTVQCNGKSDPHCTTPESNELDDLITQYYPEHGPYLGILAQFVGNEKGRIKIGDCVKKMDSCYLPWYWRFLHCLGAICYALTTLELYKQGKTIEWIFNGLTFTTSVCWSASRYGGPDSFLMQLDHAVAYLVIGLNYSLACNWNDGLFGFFYGSWTTIQTQAFILCHLAIPVYFCEDILRTKYKVEEWVHYGLLHFMWRLLGGMGGLFVAIGSRDSFSVFNFFG